ncbi:peptide-methionine (S)-S-oxide reductase [Sphingomonas koreensis]|jgi:peptide-methionine (S)-S-oxide reductase|uniref:peptide-methionine (S)-S-oxide reductase n=1 Tax=Sphingomonas koreensis TaxID=93064 RepID=UPI0007E26453|nr:peptide-methionine (S)-S-oxide reductase [Sphingomonas koreensis]MDC7812256.1 peptide-methionine (S)-S-oxide reductase [Sphingomonas koreensis]
MKIGFGGGCHWCTEGVFQALRGVTQVDQGFIQSEPPADTWAEGVIVTFDPSVISLETLAEVHLRTHSSGRARSPRGKYRSAVYTFEPTQLSEAERAVHRFAEEAAKEIHTQVIPFVGFLPSDERYQNYYRTDPTRPFCRRYIDPKLDFIRREYADIALPSE